MWAKGRFQSISSCAVSDHTSTHLDIWFAVDGYDLSPGQPIAISKPANFKVLVSQWSPTAQVDPFLEFFFCCYETSFTPQDSLKNPKIIKRPTAHQMRVLHGRVWFILAHRIQLELGQRAT